ncbi:MAG TPA: hypothetical protein ENH62_05285 [Marinobacter sp.]|uniref:Uncharacterized protein n=1 Tax=marine sediment metagenome TaxID=412755 RepID=A0A0F9LAJ6_9ZZZZ|nr:hypothetical protein [Marinobacter sp.]
MKRIAFILLLIVSALLWGYMPPTDYVETNDRVFTNVGQQVELQERLIDDEPNPLFVKYRNANSRVWTENGDDWEVVWRRVGIPASEQVMATGVSSCKAEERQPIYVRVRIEEARTILPVPEEVP